MKKGMFLLIALTLLAGCVEVHGPHVPPGQMKKPIAPGQMKKL